MSMSGVVLVGGFSRRMGVDKATLPWSGGGTLLDHQIETLRAAGAHPLMIGGRADQTHLRPDLPWISDAADAPGPLGGLLSALANCTCDHVAVLAVDMPWFPASLFGEWRQTKVPGCGWVIQGPKGYEPLAALYPKTALVTLEAGAKQGVYRLQDLVQTMVQTRCLQVWTAPLPSTKCLSNWNYPQDIAG